MNNDLNQNINNNVAPQPMPNTNPMEPQTIPNPVPQQPVQPQPMNTMNTGMAQPMSNPMPQEPMMNQAPAQTMGNPMPEQQMNPQQMNMQQPTKEQPEPPKEKKKSNPVLIFLMFVALIGGAGYFGYNYFIANKDVNSNTNNSGTTDTNALMQNDEAEKIVKELFENPTVQYLTDFPSITYCQTDDKTYTEEELGIEQKWNGYKKCTDYKTYSELSNHFKSFFTEEFYNNSISNKGAVPQKNSTGLYNYFEKDGELYAAITGKGSNVNKAQFQNNESIYEITNLQSDSISAIIDAKWLDVNNNNYEEKINITLKKVEDNWLIDSYEKQ